MRLYYNDTQREFKPVEPGADAPTWNWTLLGFYSKDVVADFLFYIEEKYGQIEAWKYGHRYPPLDIVSMELTLFARLRRYETANYIATAEDGGREPLE